MKNVNRIVEIKGQLDHLNEQITKLKKLKDCDVEAYRGSFIEIGGSSTHSKYYYETKEEQTVVADFLIDLWTSKIDNMEEELKTYLK